MPTRRTRAGKQPLAETAGGCAVCGETSQRVAVDCAACSRSFHLGCLTPPLRRRPVLVDAWQCPDCKDQVGAGGEAVNKQRKRSAAQTHDGDCEPTQVTTALKSSNSSQQEKEAAPKKRRLSTRAAVRAVANTTLESASAQLDSDGSASEDASIATTRTKRAAGKAALKKKKKSPTPVATQRNGRVSRRAASGKAPRYGNSDEDDDDDDDDDDDSDGDNDNDSDFVEETASEEEATSDQEASDEALVRPARGRPAKSKARTQRPAAPKARRRPAPQPSARPPPARDTVNTNAVVSDSDSLVVEFSGEESPEEEEVYNGPHYYIEYAANGRAKCKSCEKKLPAEILRVGIRIRHSIFGITTYFKHLECTAIGLATFSGEEGKEPRANKPSEPIEGLSRLKPLDQKRVREYMAKNDEEGVMDERLELADNHFIKKDRLPEKEPSRHLTATLLPYQREALGWMTAQEESDYKGGILADEMGMGKTIQAISLILENVRLPDQPAKKKGPKSRNPPIPRGGTLVVCPLVAIMQWKSEIERFVERGHLSIYIHHGPKRLDLSAKIASYDIVLTTYSIVESEIRKTLGWSKVACKYCGKKYLPDKLISHNKYFCGPNAKKTALQDKQDTKKRRKKAAGESSEEDDYPKKPEPKSKRKASPRVKKNQEDDEDDLHPKKIKGKSPLHQIQWTRIVLDEAHYIKDRNCNTARGVFALKSDFKWCLTGTPLQNRIGELFSLVRFLQVRKFAFYHCTMCDCQMLDYNFPDRKCEQCSHAATQHFSFFNKKIVIPIQSYGYVAEGKLAMQRLQNQVLQHILLRRTKEGRADDISLPPKLVRVRKDRLDERENDFYEAIYTQSQAQFNTYVSSGTLLNNYAHIFDLLIRLRQAVDHPYLVIYSKSNPALQLPAANLVEQQPFRSNDDDNADDVRLCTICHEDAEDVVVAKCGHDFCRECVKEFIESLPVGGEATCPECSKPLTVDLAPTTDVEAIDTTVQPSSRSPKTVDLSKFRRHSILHRISDVHAFQSSTKIEALMQELELMKTHDPSGKAIIFSQFVNMLDLIQHRLELGGVKCVKMSGSMSMQARDATIKAFRDDPTVTAFLISLKAGGVALNLTVASHIFLMDPWWNPAAENQAIDRTHRLGQFKPIQATRFIIAGTVEERILKLQEKKRLIFEGTVGANVSAICRLTEEDLRFLFAT